MEKVMKISDESMIAINTSLQSRGVTNECPICHAEGKMNLDSDTLSIFSETGLVHDFIIMQCLNCFHIQLFMANGYNLTKIVSE
jgi:hypothetical protein